MELQILAEFTLKFSSGGPIPIKSSYLRVSEGKENTENCIMCI